LEFETFFTLFLSISNFPSPTALFFNLSYFLKLLFFQTAIFPIFKPNNLPNFRLNKLLKELNRISFDIKPLLNLFKHCVSLLSNFQKKNIALILYPFKLILVKKCEIFKLAYNFRLENWIEKTGQKRDKIQKVNPIR